MRLRVVVALLALAAAGCGDQGPERDVSGVRATFAAFARAVNGGDFAGACARYTPQAQLRLAHDGERLLGITDGACPAVLARIEPRLGPQGGQLEDVEVDGDRAVATNPGSRSDRRVRFRREQGRWLIDESVP